jgi:hypothetical protein
MKLQKDSSNNCIVTRLKNVREHSNADRLQLATVLGTQVVVGLDAKEGDVVLYFDSNLRVGHKFLHHNNLYSNPEMNEDKKTKGYFPKTGRVKCQRFRGEMSNGYVAEPYMLLNIPGITENIFDEGTEFTHIDGIEIAAKYIPLRGNAIGTKQRAKELKKYMISNMFHRHWETQQLMRNLDMLVPGPIFVEEKVHGTSGRTANAKFLKRWWKRLFPWQDKYEYRIVSGTRRVDHITHHMPSVRQEIERKIGPHLRKGEEVYYEIFGNEPSGKAIQDGFPYGCRGGEFKVMLYRVTFTNEDGYCIDTDRQYVYRRAVELGMLAPVVIDTGIIFPNDLENIHEIAAEIRQMAEGNSAIDGGTIKEGVVVWFQKDNGHWTCLKYKTETFLLKESKKLDKGVVDCEDLL